MNEALATPVPQLRLKQWKLIQDEKLPKTLNCSAVEAAVARYGAFASKDADLSPSDAMDAIETLIGQSDTLATALVRLPSKVTEALSLASARPGRAPIWETVTGAREALRLLADALELARREIDDGPKRLGRPPSPRAVLVLDLASILERAGARDHGSGGPLCSLTDLGLKSHGERFGRVWQIVETALKLRQTGASEIA
jgi:hypothetical protein